MILLVFSCTNQSEEELEFYPSFQEKELSFLHLKHGFPIDTTTTWIRKSENILMLHETFKKFGYDILLTECNWKDEPTLAVGYINNSIYNLIDSLETTYQDYKNAPKYYKEFWERRENEKNNEAVYKVISEVKNIVIDKKTVPQEVSMINDTLVQLLSIEFKEEPITNEDANQALEYLIQIGLHQSAYNWRSGEYLLIESINWERSLDTIKTMLIESENNVYPWFPDTNK
jgi:hypothetical protein